MCQLKLKIISNVNTIYILFSEITFYEVPEAAFHLKPSRQDSDTTRFFSRVGLMENRQGREVRGLKLEITSPVNSFSSEAFWEKYQRKQKEKTVSATLLLGDPITPLK